MKPFFGSDLFAPFYGPSREEICRRVRARITALSVWLDETAPQIALGAARGYVDLRAKEFAAKWSERISLRSRLESLSESSRVIN